MESYETFESSRSGTKAHNFFAVYRSSRTEGYPMAPRYSSTPGTRRSRRANLPPCRGASSFPGLGSAYERGPDGCDWPADGRASRQDGRTQGGYGRFASERTSRAAVCVQGNRNLRGARSTRHARVRTRRTYGHAHGRG